MAKGGLVISCPTGQSGLLIGRLWHFCCGHGCNHRFGTDILQVWHRYGTGRFGSVQVSDRSAGARLHQRSRNASPDL